MAAPGVTTLCRDCFRIAAQAAASRCPACASPRLVRHPELERLAIAHVDCDAFYASVEKRDRPELRDEPVIVGGGRRGVVSTCCYIARTFGVRSAMPMFKALKACPEATVIRPDFAKYQIESRRIMALLGGLTPLVQPLSLDEAWLDLSGTERLNRGPPALALARVQARIEEETGLTVSVGLAPNKFLAKIASERDKPRGFCVLGAQEARAFLAPRPAGVLPGVGPVFAKALERAGFATVGALAAADPRALADRFGAAGLRLSRLAQGLDVREVDPDQARKSLSAETTFERDLSALSDLEDALWPLCEKVARRARADGVAGRVAVLKLKGADFRAVSRRRTLPAPTMAARTLFSEARTLLAEEARSGRAFRLVGAGLTGLAPSGEVAAELFADEDGRAARTETTVDALRARFGPTAVISGRAFNTWVKNSRGRPDGGRGKE